MTIGYILVDISKPIEVAGLTEHILVCTISAILGSTPIGRVATIADVASTAVGRKGDIVHMTRVSGLVLTFHVHTQAKGLLYLEQGVCIGYIAWYVIGATSGITRRT